MVDYSRGNAHRGDPGFFSSIGRAIGGVARAAVNILPGPVGAVARTVVGAATSRPSATPATLAGVGNLPVIRSPGITGAIQRMVPGGATGYEVAGRKRSRRMNPGNAQAARRAIRRIKGVRNLLKSIERQMPRRPCTKPHRKGR